MTPKQARAERARLIQEIDNAAAAVGRARRDRVAAERAKEDDQRERAQLLGKMAREGQTLELIAQAGELTQRIESVPQVVADVEAQLEAGARAQRDAETELQYLLQDELHHFLGDVEKLAEDAETKLAAVAPAVAEAARAHQVATLEYAKLAKAVTEALRTRDKDDGVYPPESRYQRATQVPEFPLPLVASYVARPPGVQQLAQKAPVAAKAA